MATAIDQQDEEIRYGNLLLWLEQHGGQLHPSLRITRSESSGLSIIAKEYLGPDQAAVRVPAALCVTTELARTSLIKLLGIKTEEDGRCSGDEHLDEKAWITLYLVLHRLARFADVEDEEVRPGKRQRIERSSIGLLDDCLKHQVYVDLLPKHTMLPSVRNGRDLAYLKGTPLYEHTINHRLQVKQRCEGVRVWLKGIIDPWKAIPYWAKDVTATLQQESQADARSDGSDDDERKRQGQDEFQSFHLLWRWAESMQSSRAFPPRVIGATGAPILVPVLDLFNHNREAKVTWFHDVITAPTTPTVSLRLHYSIQAGQEAYNTYGPRANEELFSSYGFVDPDMKDDYYTLKLQGGARYHWRFNQHCPEDLLEEIKVLSRKDPSFRSAVDELTQQYDNDNESLVSLAEDMIALQDIHALLLDKQDKLYQSEVIFDTTVAARAMKSEKGQLERSTNEFVHLCEVYRKGHKRVLASAILIIGSDIEAIESRLDGRCIDTQKPDP